MNRKGQMTGVGVVLVVFVACLIGLVIFEQVAQSVGSATSTVATGNNTITMPASGTAYNLKGQAVVGSVTAWNASNNDSITPGNYVLANNQVVNGVLTATLTPNATAAANNYTGHSVIVSYTFEPDGYVGGSARSVALIIPIFAAIAIMITALVPTLRNKVLELVGVK